MHILALLREFPKPFISSLKRSLNRLGICKITSFPILLYTSSLQPSKITKIISEDKKKITKHQPGLKKWIMKKKAPFPKVIMKNEKWNDYSHCSCYLLEHLLPLDDWLESHVVTFNWNKFKANKYKPTIKTITIATN